MGIFIFHQALLFSALISQSPDLNEPTIDSSEGLPENLESPAPPNDGASPPENFKDPFQEQSSPLPTPDPSIQPAPGPNPSLSPELSPADSPLLPPGGPAGAPNLPEPPDANAPAIQPSPDSQIPDSTPGFEQPPVSGAAPAVGGAPKTDFQFPDQTKEDQQVPVTKDVMIAEDLQKGTEVGSWHIDPGLGFGIKLSNIKNQVDLHLGGGYRLYENWEVGALLNYRFIGDYLLGFLGTAHYVWRFTKPPHVRMDLLTGGGLGYTLFAPHRQYTFGLVTLRMDATLLVYAWNKFAFSPSLGLEMFPFGWSTKGHARSGARGGGMPVQAILGVGIRTEF